MKTINIQSVLFKLKVTGLLLPVFFLMSFRDTPADNLVIIVSQSNPVTSLTPGEAKDIYLRKESKRWKELNINIIPIDVKGDTESKALFLKGILKMTKIEMYKYFSEREYQNQETFPTRVPTDEEVINFVHQNSGAIGYVMSSSVAGNKDVKVVCTLAL